VAYLEKGDVGAARENMERASALSPEQAVYHALRGLLALQQREGEAAEQALARAIELGHPDEERLAGFFLWRARARDLRGRRADALRDYRMSLALHADEPVRAAAKSGVRRSYAAAACARIQIEVSMGDVISP
jgi:tetratricopeptide (TPR) repeat protein